MPTGIYLRTEYHKRILSNAQKRAYKNGRRIPRHNKLSHKTKEKISLSLKKYYKSPSAKKRLKDFHKKMLGHKVSIITRLKIAEKARGRKMPLWVRKKLSLIHGGTGIPYENTEYGLEFDSNLKEQVRFRDKYKCQLCGCTQIENGKQLDCHHIDYDKKNNRLSNLVALCVSCHRRTKNNRKYWIKLILNLQRKRGILK